jgi:ubiquinol-cytochrome c reductase cytochrome c subunit
MTSMFLRRVGVFSFAAMVGAGPLLVFASGSGASTNPHTAYQTTRKNAGTPNSSQVKLHSKTGVVISYGNKYITYNAPSTALVTLGQALFLQNCASCHGNEANGVPANGTSGSFPDLVGLGPATIDFWVDSGRMPAANVRAVQAIRHIPRLNKAQAVAIAAWVNSLDPSYPDLPTPHLNNANVSDGAALFALNCAACHTIEGDGDALANDTYAPSLRDIPAFEVVEAVRTGPANMPRFTGNLSDQQVDDIVKYVTTEIQHPQNPGGFGLGGLGPVAEGFVGLLVGVGILMLIAYWVGDRS